MCRCLAPLSPPESCSPGKTDTRRHSRRLETSWCRSSSSLSRLYGRFISSLSDAFGQNGHLQVLCLCPAQCLRNKIDIFVTYFLLSWNFYVWALGSCFDDIWIYRSSFSNGTGIVLNWNIKFFRGCQSDLMVKRDNKKKSMNRSKNRLNNIAV